MRLERIRAIGFVIMMLGLWAGPAAMGAAAIPGRAPAERSSPEPGPSAEEGWHRFSGTFADFYRRGLNQSGYLYLQVRGRGGEIRHVLLGDCDWQGRRGGEGVADRAIDDDEVVVAYRDLRAVLSGLR